MRIKIFAGDSYYSQTWKCSAFGEWPKNAIDDAYSLSSYMIASGYQWVTRVNIETGNIIGSINAQRYPVPGND